MLSVELLQGILVKPYNHTHIFWDSYWFLLVLFFVYPRNEVADFLFQDGIRGEG